MMNMTAAHIPRIQKNQSYSTIRSLQKVSFIELVPLVSEWKRRVFYRKELRRLLETGRHLVVDTGIGIDEALYEISKPFYIE